MKARQVLLGSNNFKSGKEETPPESELQIITAQLLEALEANKEYTNHEQDFIRERAEKIEAFRESLLLCLKLAPPSEKDEELKSFYAANLTILFRESYSDIKEITKIAAGIADLIVETKDTRFEHSITLTKTFDSINLGTDDEPIILSMEFISHLVKYDKIFVDRNPFQEKIIKDLESQGLVKWNSSASNGGDVYIPTERFKEILEPKKLYLNQQLAKGWLL